MSVVSYSFVVANEDGPWEMRSLKRHKNWAFIAVLGIFTWLLFSRTLPSSSAQAPAPVPPPSPSLAPAPVPSRSDASSVFTTDHGSAIAAVRDFLGLRSEPVQPINFPHNTHLANNLKCLDCHAGADVGPDAVMPSAKFCMTCHLVIATEKPEIKKLAAFRARGEDIAWARVYDYSQYAHVRFNHAPHIRANVPCSSCHGDMTKQTTAKRVVNINMNYCLRCHEERNVSVDCETCHY